MRFLLALCSLLALGVSTVGRADGKFIATPYQPAKAVFEFYLDDPQKIGSALYWLRSVMNPLMEAPYGYAPEDLDIVVVLHGTEIVTVASRNEARYREAVDRMRYYASLGVKFKVCGEAAEEFGYAVRDFQDFIEVVPNAITELVHWQMQGYALITPRISEKKFTIESIR